jgi:hypothetical protein
MHPERVVITRVSTVVVATVAAVAAGALGSLLLGNLFPIIQIIIISSGSCLRARAMIIGIVAPPIVFRLG